MKTVLIQAPAFGIDRPPIGLAYLSAYLRKHGFCVTVQDLNALLYSVLSEQDRKYWDFQYVFEWVDGNVFNKPGFLPADFFKAQAAKIAENKPEVAGFSVHSTSLFASLLLASELKKLLPSIFIVFGGPLNLSYSIDHAYYLLQKKDEQGGCIVDAVALGEGEEILLELLLRLKDGASLEGCQGTVVRSSSGFANNGLRPLIKDLNALPFPDFSDLPDLYKYRKTRLPILGSRGCIHRCVFCDDTLMWRQYRTRTPENIIEEMKLRKHQGVEFLEFNDLLINASLPNLSRFCDLLIKEGLNIPWGASASINGRMDPGIFKKMKAAGCCYLNYGIESASPKVLKDMNKGFKPDEIRKTVINTYKAGIDVCTNWIVGFPTETRRDFQETLNFVKKNYEYLQNNLMVNSFILKGNSFLFENQQKYGIVSDQQRNWHSQSGENNVEERKRRYEEFLEMVGSLGDSPAHHTFQK